MKTIIPANIRKKRSHCKMAKVLFSMPVFFMLSTGLSCTRTDPLSAEPAQHYDRSLSRLTELAGPPDPPELISSPVAAAAAAAAEPITAPVSTAPAAPAPTGSHQAAAPGAPVSLPPQPTPAAAPAPTAAQPLSLYFYADSANQLLPGEEEKLAAFVQRIHQPGSGIRTLTLLGYAADTGNPAGENNISGQRAAYLASRLQQAGLPAGIIISTSGRGAARLSRPLTPDEAAAASRRVDILTE